MKRRKMDKIARQIKRYLYLPLTIVIGLFLFGYMGKVAVELIARADFTENNLLGKIFSENENEPESKNETKIGNEEAKGKNDKNKLVEETENKEVVTIILEELFNDGEKVEGDGWIYTHYLDDNSGKLELDSSKEYILQNKENGLKAEVSLPIHIIVREGANYSNITLNNINISRPTRINSTNDSLGLSEEANAPIFIKSENTTITLAENTTNYIDATDSKVATDNNRSIRSAIYLYSGTADQAYSLNIAGLGKLICEDGGINTYAVETATSNIIIISGDITVNIVNWSNRTGIGSNSINNNNFGNLSIQILGGNVKINIENTSTYHYATGIGTARTIGTINSVEIRINGDSKVSVNMNLKQVQGYASCIGTGLNMSTSSLNIVGVTSLVIEIDDSPFVEVIQNIKPDSYLNCEGAAIGTSDESYINSEINLKGGQIKVLDAGSAYRLTLGGASIGEGIDNASILFNLKERMTINITGDVTLDINGRNGIGANGSYDAKGEVNVNISRGDDGKVPSILVTTFSTDYSKVSSIVERGGTGTTDSVMLSHLYLGYATGPTWADWSQEPEKNLQIIESASGNVLREVTIPGNVTSIAYTLPKIDTETDTNVNITYDTTEGGFITAGTKSRIIKASNNLEKIPVIFKLLIPLPALRTLYDGAKDDSGSTWDYKHDSTGGTLRLIETDNFVLKNLESGDSDEGSVPVHIIVERGADNSNITLKNINISRPRGIDVNTRLLSTSDPQNAPFFIDTLSTTITLANGTTNSINAKDHSVSGNTSRRSAIYSRDSKLRITGNGKLVCEDAGINMYTNTDQVSSSIIIEETNIEVNVKGNNRTGIGYIYTEVKYGEKGNVNIEIINSNVKVTVDNPDEDASSSAIGTSYSQDNFNEVKIKISQNSNVFVDMNYSNTERITMRAPAIGGGPKSGGVVVKEFLIEIIDGSTVEVKQSIAAIETVNMYASILGLGAGSGAQYPDSKINIEDAKVTVSQIVGTNTVADNGSKSIGEGIGNIDKMELNISGDTVLDVNAYKGIGANMIDDYKDGDVVININGNDNGTPNLLVTAQKGQAVAYRGHLGISNVMISHLDLGEDRTGTNWVDWDDDVEKTLQIVTADNNSVLREVTIPGNVQSVAYTLPDVSTATDTNVKVSFASGDGNSISRNFVNAETGNDIITASNNLEAISVIFDLLLPALRTLYEGGSTGGSTWNYTADGTGGTLRLTDTDDFVLQNLESSALDTESVPIHIIVEKAASGSNITFNNLNIKRAGSAESKTPILNADSELIAPFMIKDAATINIILAEGSENIIDGQDSLLENAGYRTAIYMHAPTASTYTLKIGRENPAATTPAPRLTTLNGGINALGVEDTNINMQLKDSNYDLNAVNNNYEHAVAFGSGYTSENINSGNYNLVLEAINENNSTTVRALGNDVAIGHNGNLSTSTVSVKGEVNLQAIAFTDGNAISGKFDYSALSFKTTLNKADNWKSIVMHPYSDELITNNFWEFNLPETSFYPTETGQNVTIAYSSPEIDTVRETSPFERMALRISNDDNIQFLANTDGTGSTTPIILPNNEVSNRSNMLPTSADFGINIPKITLKSNLSDRTLTTPDGEVRNVTNDSALPLALAFAGSILGSVPTGVDVDNFATSRENFAAVNGTEVAKLLLELNINKANNSGDINFNDEQMQTLIPSSNIPEEKDYVNIATLRGAHNDEVSAVDLSVTGMYTEAASQNINGDFINTVYLKFSLLDFAEFN